MPVIDHKDFLLSVNIKKLNCDVVGISVEGISYELSNSIWQLGVHLEAKVLDCPRLKFKFQFG